jgi:glycosyltransferase involved in cell wall biosynthesis
VLQFEALAAGKAILTGDFGEIGRIVKENQCGYILKDYTESEIARVLSELGSGTLAMQRDCSRQAGERRYNWQSATMALISSYQSPLIEERT